MPNYRRFRRAGGTYFFTVVTHGRVPLLCQDEARATLREAITRTRVRHPFTVVAWVLLPDHMHCVWELPEETADFSVRWRLIKARFTHHVGPQFRRPIWQPRFWGHCIRDQNSMNRHIDYIHFNPVKHGLVAEVKDWPYSSYHRYRIRGFYQTEGRLRDDIDIQGAD